MFGSKYSTKSKKSSKTSFLFLLCLFLSDVSCCRLRRIATDFISGKKSPGSVMPHQATDEAILLIGGKRCTSAECRVPVTRIEKGRPVKRIITIAAYDRELKFLTEFGLCTAFNQRAPLLPEASSSMGAFVLNDGRVLICGGNSLDLDSIDGKYMMKNLTVCRTWRAGSYTIQKEPLYNKFLFDWPGPLTPKLAHVLDFKPKMKEIDEDDPTKWQRMIMVPWPEFTTGARAAKTPGERIVAPGDVIVGKIRLKEYGPKILFHKLKLESMPVGYGGCVSPQRLNQRMYRMHTFGGRQMGINFRLAETGWTANPAEVTKYPRYFNLALDPKRVDSDDLDVFVADDQGEIDENRRVRRPICLDLQEDLDQREQLEKKLFKLEEDRVYATCHTLPKKFSEIAQGNGSRGDIILVGGGDGKFFDRPSILPSLLHSKHRNIARYTMLEENPENCTLPKDMNGRGTWVAEDLRFGYGLNIPRSRHASERIHVTNPCGKDSKRKELLFVIGGFDLNTMNISDTIEMLELRPADQIMDNFYVFDALNKSEASFRLPWPLFDITTARIPVDWLPEECYEEWRRKKDEQKCEE